MSDNVKVALITGVCSIVLAIISALVTLAIEAQDLNDASDRVDDAEKKVNVAVENVSALSRRMEQRNDPLSATPSFDSSWIDIGSACDTKELELPSNKLPTILTAYYKLRESGEIFPLGTNQYGATNQTNGDLIDLRPEERKIFIRLPCHKDENGDWIEDVGRAVEHSVNLGWYTGLSGRGGTEIRRPSSIQIRVIGWL